jgi:hypothetical protein
MDVQVPPQMCRRPELLVASFPVAGIRPLLFRQVRPQVRMKMSSAKIRLTALWTRVPSLSRQLALGQVGDLAYLARM